MFKALVALVAASLSFSAFATPDRAPATGRVLAFAAPQLQFKYLTFDGETDVDCTHEVFNAAGGDWTVRCAVGGVKHEYRVHLWVSLYTHTTAPRASYEILYWIDDRTQAGKSDGHSSTVWFHLKDPSALSALEFRQSVDQDTAYLELTFAPDSAIR